MVRGMVVGNLRQKKISLFILFLSGFIDYAGVALVYPLFTYMLFDFRHHFLPDGTSEVIRGLWLGILLALLPLAQFFSSPVLGFISDQRGRKNVLLTSLVIGCLGYMVAMVGVMMESLSLLALYRILVGIAAGNASVVGAIVADVSTPQEKAKHFGYLSVAFGAGFTLGPCLGGLLIESFTTVGLLLPFLVALMLVCLNLILVYTKLPETRPAAVRIQVRWLMSISQVRQGLSMTHLRGILITILVYTLGWSFFTEFIPLFLIERYHFSPKDIGYYYAYTGLFYALGAGLFIQPLLRFMKPKTLLHTSLFLSGFYVLLFLFIHDPKILWLYLPLSQCLIAFVYPTTSAVISNRVNENIQGEVQGMYQAIMALAMAICPLFSGIFVGVYPILSIIVGGIVMVLAGVLFHFYDFKSDLHEKPFVEHE